MKVALLFSGQYRTIPSDVFLRSIETLVKGIDHSIYVSSWEESGISMDHLNKVPLIQREKNLDLKIKSLFSDFNLVKVEFENYFQFKSSLDKRYKKILNSTKFHKGTIHSLPQLYKISRSYRLFEAEKENYDLVFRCRFDSVFLHPLKLFPLNKFGESNNLYNINFGRSYYPNRVYDIFFGGSVDSMSFLDNLWNEIPDLIDNKFDNGLDKRDACRLLFLSATNKNHSVDTFDVRICDVYRKEDFRYLSYLISSHFTKIKINNTTLQSWKYLFLWIHFRRIMRINVLLILLKTFIFIPISYIKRFKYYLNTK